MSVDAATTSSRLARHEPVRESDFPSKLSFAYLSFLASALFNVFFLLWTLTVSVSLCILLYQLTATPGPPDVDGQSLTAALVVSLLADLLFFSWRLHNRASTPQSWIGRSAYFREKPAAIVRLCGSSPHHRRLFFRWQPSLRWLLPLDVLAFAVCVLPTHAILQPQQLFAWPAGELRLDAYQQALRIMAVLVEVVVGLEAVIELFRRLCGPRDTQYQQPIVVWHPGARSPNRQQYRQALLQHTPPHTGRGISAYPPPSEHPVHPPPAYGHQDIEDAYSMPQSPQLLPPHLQHQYAQQHPPPLQVPYYHHQHHQPYMPQPLPPPVQQRPYQPPPQPQPHPYAAQPPPQPPPRAQYSRLDGAEQVEGRPQREGKVDEERAEGQAEGVAGVQGGEGGEQGAVTQPLVMMMSPALMDDEGGGGAGAVSRPRVMLSARASDADRLDAPSQANQSPQVLSPPRYAVVHMSST